METKKRETIVVLFSGGRTSAYMCWWLKKYMNHLYKFVFVYANTGLEHKKTIKFVKKCDKEFALKLVYLEAKVNHNERKSTSYNVIKRKNLSIKGEPFEEVIKKYGLPNQNFLHCTRELKINPIQHWMKDNGYGKCRRALGIRVDEYKRVKNDKDYFYPLATISPTTKEYILNWWSEQTFDLDLPEHLGNCVGCYKKSDNKLDLVAKENPSALKFFCDMESKYPDEKRQIFRHHRTAYEVLFGLNKPNKNTKIDECAEECGSVIHYGN